MADIDDYGMAPDDGDAGPSGGQSLPQIDGGLLDPRTFPAYLLGGGQSLAGTLAQNAGASPDTDDSDVHAEVERDIQKAQAALPAIDYPQIAPQAPLITGPLMTDPHLDALQNVFNAQAGLPPVRPHPETWSVNGQPYLAIGANTFDPARSNGVTSMPTPQDSAAAFEGKGLVAAPSGLSERAGYIAHDPSTVIPVQGKSSSSLGADIYTYYAPVGLPKIHGHIDSGEHMSVGMVDSPLDNGGLGDSYSLRGEYPAPMATVSHNQVGWHVLDNGQLKFLYPQGSMNRDQIQAMQNNLDREQGKFLRSK